MPSNRQREVQASRLPLRAEVSQRLRMQRSKVGRPVGLVTMGLLGSDQRDRSMPRETYEYSGRHRSIGFVLKLLTTSEESEKSGYSDICVVRQPGPNKRIVASSQAMQPVQGEGQIQSFRYLNNPVGIDPRFALKAIEDSMKPSDYRRVERLIDQWTPMVAGDNEHTPLHLAEE